MVKWQFRWNSVSERSRHVSFISCFLAPSHMEVARKVAAPSAAKLCSSSSYGQSIRDEQRVGDSGHCNMSHRLHRSWPEEQTSFLLGFTWFKLTFQSRHIRLDSDDSRQMATGCSDVFHFQCLNTKLTAFVTNLPLFRLFWLICWSTELTLRAPRVAQFHSNSPNFRLKVDVFLVISANCSSRFVWPNKKEESDVGQLKFRAAHTGASAGDGIANDFRPTSGGPSRCCDWFPWPRFLLLRLFPPTSIRFSSFWSWR